MRTTTEDLTIHKVRLRNDERGPGWVELVGPEREASVLVSHEQATRLTVGQKVTVAYTTSGATLTLLPT